MTMPGPTQDLINRCYAVLERCEQFETSDYLRSVFVSDELSPFRNHVKDDAPSISARVRLTVDYLLYQRTADDRHAFVIFLEVLRSSVKSGNALHNHIDALCSEFAQSLSQVSRINLPYVVVAMTEDEAGTLQSGDVFEDTKIAPFERDRFNTLAPSLPEGWVKDYGEQRDNWKLHTDHSSVMAVVLNEMFAHVNRCLRQPHNLPVIDGVSYSEAFFSADQQVETWDRLRRSGGLLVVDAISLFYPPIRKILQKSALISNEQIAFLVLSPLDFHASPINGQVEALVKEEMPVPFERYNDYLEHRYEIGSGNLRSVRRWLFNLFHKPEDMAGSIQRSKKNEGLKRFSSQESRTGGKMGATIYRQREVGQ
jgi:hypothetical protein